MSLTLIDLALIAIVVAAISLLVKTWPSSKKWKPLLTNEIYPPVMPLETDQTKRNKILKRGNFSNRNV
jgi:hypothetical protein